MINVPITQEQIEDMNKPTLAVGEYLAVITSVEEKVNEVKGSVGLNWSLLVNSNPASKNEGWDTEAKVVAIDHYTYMGKKDDSGKLVMTPNPFALAGMFSALGISGSFDPATVRHAQVIVNIKHEASMQDQEALAADPTHQVERYFPKVKFVKPYRQGANLAPKLAHLADAVENDTAKPADDGDDPF